MKRARLPFAMAAAACLFLSASANAQVRESTEQLGSEPTAIQAMHNFAACVVNRNPAAAANVLAMDFRTKQYQEAIRRIAKGNSGCAVRSTLRFNQVLLAGGMAEALLHRAVTSPVAYRPGNAPVEARSEVEAAALCVVRASPAQTTALFQTEPTTEEERKAMNQITPFLSRCITKDAALSFNQPGLRSILALAGYRLTHLPVSGN
jgi:hypothetical protein